jgi:hypothetical protein
MAEEALIQTWRDVRRPGPDEEPPELLPNPRVWLDDSPLGPEDFPDSLSDVSGGCHSHFLGCTSMPRKTPNRNHVTRVFVGVVPAFTGKLMIVDPGCLENFVTESMEANGFATRGKQGFGYSGTRNVAGSKRKAGQILDSAGENIAVATAAPEFADCPVYALVRDGKVVRLVIVFDGDPCREAPTQKAPRRRRRRKGF